MIPLKYFVVSGSGVSKTSRLNAFDRALAKAGIDQCNLVTVSSILPKDAVQIKPIEFSPGTITFCVISRMGGEEGETIGAGIGWSKCINPKNKEAFGIVAEDFGDKSPKFLERDIKQKLGEMADSRGMKLLSTKIKTETLKVPKGSFGSVVAALVYVFE